MLIFRIQACWYYLIWRCENLLLNVVALDVAVDIHEVILVGCAQNLEYRMIILDTDYNDVMKSNMDWWLDNLKKTGSLW